MRNRPGLIFLSLMLLSLYSSAQLSVGVEGGYNKNYLVTNNANRAFTNYLPLSGFNIGIPVQYQISSWFAVAAVPSYIQRNYRQERSSFFAGVYQNTYNNYIQLPLTGRFIFGGERLRGFADAGLYAGYWMSGKVKGVMSNILDIPESGSSTSSIFDFQKAYSYNEKYSFNKTRDNRLELGWVAGLGIGYDITSRYHVFTEAKIFYSFTDQQKNYMTNQIPRYNTTYSINAGVMYNLKNSKNTN